jgi:hypothetical protein
VLVEMVDDSKKIYSVTVNIYVAAEAERLASQTPKPFTNVSASDFEGSAPFFKSKALETDLTATLSEPDMIGRCSITFSEEIYKVKRESLQDKMAVLTSIVSMNSKSQEPVPKVTYEVVNVSENSIDL